MSLAHKLSSIIDSFDTTEVFLPFSRPCLSLETIEAATQCLSSGWLATGPHVQTFEADLQAYFQAPHALTVTSATGGLFLALKALDLQEGDEVITTPLTFVATLNTIIHAGAKPVLVDIDSSTRNIRTDLIEQVITPRTRAIMPVHFAGLSVDMTALMDTAKRHNLRVIEDAAHAMGATYNRQKIGSFGDIQVFSFHPCKNMTSAEGGCIITRDDALAQRIKSLRFFGIDRDAWNRHAKGGSSAYDVKEAGYKFNMSDLQGVIGLHQLKELDFMNQKRRDMAVYYRQQLQTISGLELPGASKHDFENAWHVFAVTVHEKEFGMDRDILAETLKHMNIGTGHHYPAVHLYTYFQKTFGWKKGDFPAAEDVGARIISLPFFPHMTRKDQDYVISALKHIKHTLNERS